jgi:probable rRNA maturation factor
LKIRIFYEDVNFRLDGWRNIKKLIEKVIRGENKIPGDLIFILTNNKVVRKLNKEFLKHNYNTDVISFDWDGDENINGEIYISVETVKLNSLNYKVSYKSELVRVIVHGVLHLCGYNDKSIKEKEEIRRREDYWLRIYEKIE